MKENNSNLNLAVVPQTFLDEITSEIKEMKNLLREKTEQELNELWIESVQIPKLLNISRKTWQTYRDRKMIPFSQIGNKIYVKRVDLEAFMNAHYIDTMDRYITETKMKR